jgi:alcohol dehydrogenase, propanol-preferring
MDRFSFQRSLTCAAPLSTFRGQFHSAHLVIQLARHMFPHSEIFVFARDEETRAFARHLGAVWAGDTSDRAPAKLHAIIDTTPAWKPAVEAVKNLAPCGRLVINAIRIEDTIRGTKVLSIGV